MKQERLDYLTGKYEAKLNPSNEDEMSGSQWEEENTADLRTGRSWWTRHDGW